MADHQAELLLQAAAEAVVDFQTNRPDLSVPDILHLEKKWAKLTGANDGSPEKGAQKVALEQVKGLLAAEVLAGKPLEYVVQEVLAQLQLTAAAGTLLSKRQFFSLAHVAEVAQSKAFDLATAEDAAAPRAEPASGHKKRPPSIRDAHIDTWRIAAAPAGQQGDGMGDDGAAAGQPGYEAGSNSTGAAPAEGGSVGTVLSRATSLVPGGAHVLEAEASVPDLHLNPLYHSPLKQQQLAAEGRDAAEGAVVSEHAKASSSGLEAAAAASGQGDPKERGSWESFNSGSSAAGAAAAAALAAAAAAQQEAAAVTPPQQPHLNEAMISAAMAAGMTFMQHLQAATGSGAGQPSPLSDMNPLRQVAVAAAAAVAANSSLAGASSGGAAASSVPASPEVHSAGSGGAPAGGPQQMIAEMMAHLNMGSATPEQLQAAAASLQQHARARQQQQPRPASSHAGSAGSAASADHSGVTGRQQVSGSNDGQRRSWRAFDAENQSQQQQQQHSQQRDPSVSPQKPSRLGPRPASQAAQDCVEMPPPPPRLRAPPTGNIAGWTAMSKEDQQRCQAIFNKKGYSEVGGMERHFAMEYFAKLRMEGAVFHSAWGAADLGRDGRLGCREFCLFVQLLRGAQKGRQLPSRLTAEEAAALLGEAPMPEAAPGQMHIDTAHMRAVLGGAGGHSRQNSFAGQERAESVIHGFDPDDDDTASSVDSGIAESVISTASRRAPAHPPGSHYALGRPSMQPVRSGLGSVLGRIANGAGAYAPAYARSERGGGAPSGPAVPGVGYPGAAGAGAAAEALAQVAHSLLEVAVRSAEIRYRKPLSTPIFTLSVRDSLGRLVELPVDTHPGHYRRETSMIHSSAIVRLTTQLRSIPPGSVLFLEIKHWKADKRQFSTLAWSYAPLEKLVDFGPTAARVRGGPVDLPLFKKPVDLTLRRTRRLTSRAFDLHLSLRGIE